jgi:hypothetical protein
MGFQGHVTHDQRGHPACHPKCHSLPFRQPPLDVPCHVLACSCNMSTIVWTRSSIFSRGRSTRCNHGSWATQDGQSAVKGGRRGVGSIRIKSKYGRGSKSEIEEWANISPSTQHLPHLRRLGKSGDVWLNVAMWLCSRLMSQPPLTEGSVMRSNRSDTRQHKVGSCLSSALDEKGGTL